MIEFKKETIKSKILNPKKKFEEEIQTIERRIDPLTNEVCRLNVERATRPHQTEKVDLKELIEKSKKNCPFCPKNIERMTARFPPEVVKEGRLKLNEFVLFPNLYSFGKYHAIGVLTSKHYLELKDFKRKMWENCFSTVIKFFKLIRKKDKKTSYPLVNFNYLPPAGASILHPHVQILLTKKSTPYLRKLIKNGSIYYKKFKRNYWKDLVKTEKKIKERYIGKTSSIEWVASFAPTLNHEILGITKKSCFTKLNEKERKDLSDGLVRVLKAYYKMGIRAVNFTIYSAPIGSDVKFFSVFLRIASRSSGSFWTSDRAFMEEMHNEYVLVSLPEKTASFVKKFFE